MTHSKRPKLRAPDGAAYEVFGGQTALETDLLDETWNARNDNSRGEPLSPQALGSPPMARPARPPQSPQERAGRVHPLPQSDERFVDLTWIADGVGFVCWLIIAALAFLAAYSCMS